IALAVVTSIAGDAVSGPESVFLTFALEPPHEMINALAAMISRDKATNLGDLENCMAYFLLEPFACEARRLFIFEGLGVIPCRRMSVKFFAAVSFEIFNKRRLGSQRLLLSEWCITIPMKARTTTAGSISMSAPSRCLSRI